YRAVRSHRRPRIVTRCSDPVLASQPVDQKACEIHDSSHLSPNSNVLLEGSGARSPATLNESPSLTNPCPSASRHMIRYVTMPTTTEWIVSFRPSGAQSVDPPFTASRTKNPVYAKGPPSTESTTHDALRPSSIPTREKTSSNTGGEDGGD